MFKDVFILKKTAWHARLMKYIWNLDYRDFSHICPYFWLTIFNTMISLVILPLLFSYRTIFPFIFKWLGKFFSWSWRHIEKKLISMQDAMNAWAVRQQERWEAEQVEYLRKVREGYAKDRFMNENPVYLNEIKNDPNWFNDRIFFKSRGNKKEKNIAKWLKIFRDLHRVDPQAFDKLLSEKKEADLQKETEERLKLIARQQKEEQRQVQLQYQASIQEQQEMQDHARELAKRTAQAEQEKKNAAKAIVKADKRVANKQRIVRILKIVKPIATGFIYIVGGIAALLGLYILVQGLRITYNFFANIKHSSYVSFGNTLTQVLLYIGIIAACIGFIYLIYQLACRIRLPRMTIATPKVRFRTPKVFVKSFENFSNSFKKSFIKPLGKMFIYIGNLFPKGFKYLIWPFKKFFSGIALFFKILIQTIKNNCPAIDWKD